MVGSLISTNLSLSRSIPETKDLLSDLQRQLASGKKTTSYGGVGVDRTRLISVRSEMSQIEGYQSSISLANVRLDVMLQAAGQIATQAGDTRADAFASSFDLQANHQTLFQVETQARFDELVALLNSEAGGRYLFGGRDGSAEPVAPSQHIIKGDGARAGFEQIVDERRQADLGDDGRGRLVIPGAVGADVSISEDVVGSPFGFKLLAATSNLNGTTVTGPAGAPATVDVSFTAALPADGETLELSLLLPDGTETKVTLTARDGPTTQPGEFEIGADENATAANFQAALAAAVEDEAAVSLRSASLFVAADNFFDFDAATPPQRVDGPPFGTATALRDATDADTVIWYTGDLADLPARESAIVKADDSIYVSYGARADEEGFVTLMKQMAVIAVETFEGDAEAAATRYADLKDRVGDALSYTDGAQSPASILNELSVAQTSLGRVTERHQASTILMQDFVDTTENASIEEVATQILTLQTRLQASLQVTALLKQISLVNYL